MVKLWNFYIKKLWNYGTIKVKKLLNSGIVQLWYEIGNFQNYEIMKWWNYEFTKLRWNEIIKLGNHEIV